MLLVGRYQKGEWTVIEQKRSVERQLIRRGVKRMKAKRQAKAPAEKTGPQGRQIALVTGCGVWGIGQGVALELARSRKFATIILHYAREMEMRFVRRLRRNGVSVVLVQADFGEAEATVEKLVAEIDKLGRLDLLVNVAGVTYMADVRKVKTRKEREELIRLFRQAFEVNALTSAALTFALAPYMRRGKGRKGGKVIFIGTNHCMRGSAAHVPYPVSKGAIDGGFKSIAMALMEYYGVVANLLIPGWVRTTRHVKADKAGVYSLKEAARGNPTGRIAEPEEIGRATLFCFDCDSVAGARIVMDNGNDLVFPAVEKRGAK